MARWLWYQFYTTALFKIRSLLVLVGIISLIYVQMMIFLHLVEVCDVVLLVSNTAESRWELPAKAPPPHHFR